MQPFIDEFQFFLISIILIANTNYMLFALTNIHRHEANHEKYIHRCLKFSLTCMTVAILFVLKYLVIKVEPIENPSFYAIVLCACSIVMMLCLFVAKKYSSFSHIEPKLLDLNLMPTIILLVSSFLGIISANQLTRLCFLWFAITAIRFFYVIFVRLKIRNNAGLYYIIGSLFTIFPINACRFWLTPQLVILVNLGINTFIMFGLFMFYSQFYVSELNETYKAVVHHANELEQLNDKVSEMAFIDTFTELPNERALLMHLECAQTNVSLIQLNIRNFSVLNQLIGYNQGNLLLNELALKLKALLVPGELLYKLHSDNFIIFIADTEPVAIEAITQRLISFFTTESLLDFKLEAYYGITQLFTTDETPNKANLVLSAARLASKRAKHTGICWLSLSEYRLVKEGSDLEYHLRKAIDERAFEVFYQPQVCARTKVVCSYEALIRWQHEGVYISPTIFIPLAENTGLITAISHQVVLDVFKQVHNTHWNTDKKISINLSSHQMVESGFIHFIEEALNTYPIDPKLIVLEITETALLYDLDKVSDTIAALKTKGFEFSLDDSGYGYSSLYRFSKLNFDEVKFDRFFIKDLEQDEKLRLTFLKTVELFKLLNMRIVIEGIETKAQERFLDTQNVDVYQGYLYAQPMPLKSFN